MATTNRDFRWRTTNGNKYVDSRFGSDEHGDGTMQNPYRTITQAYYNQTSKPGIIVLRGVFSDSMVGNHSTQLIADYYGAAIWDGKGVNTLPWFGGYPNMIFINGGEEVQGSDASTVDAYKTLYGLGRANHAGYVGSAAHVYGFASSPVLVHHSKLWRGGCGGSSPTRIIYSDIIRNTGCPVILSNYRGSASTYCTYYNTRIDRQGVTGQNVGRRGTGAVTGRHYGNRCVYSKWDFFVATGSENTRDYFINCCFANDCRYYVYRAGGAGNTTKNWQVLWGTGDTEGYAYNDENSTITITVVVDEGVTPNISHVVPAMVRLGLIEESNSMQFGTDGDACIFPDQDAYDIFNDPDGLDFTLKPTAACIFPENNIYYGALPPAAHIQVYGETENIRTASDGHTWCFDNRTLTGCLKIENGSIKINEGSVATSGAILSKIMKMNPAELQYNGVYALQSDHITDKGITMNTEDYIGTKDDGNGNQVVAKYGPGDSLPAGKYLLRADNQASVDDRVMYWHPTYADYVAYKADDMLVVTADAVTGEYNKYNMSAGANGTIYAYAINDPNIQNVVYCRCRSSVYRTVASGNTLIQGITYYNPENGKSISFNGRTIVPGESFVAETTATFVCPEDNTYQIAMMFDDRTDEEIAAAGGERLVPTAPWVPAATRGEYFALKSNGIINRSTINDQLLGSGNPYSYQANGSIMAGTKSVLDQPYMQFAVFITKSV